jgi:cytochrome c-type biogenesis protein CcmF
MRGVCARWRDAGRAGGAGLAALIWLFITTDLSVKLVAENSHSAKPLIFKIAGAWGNHEGSMLLWVTIMSLAARSWRWSKRLAENTLLATLAGQAFVSRLLCVPAAFLQSLCPPAPARA